MDIPIDVPRFSARDVMHRLATNFKLKLKTEVHGKVVIKSDNIAMGLLICLIGLFIAGIFIFIASDFGVDWFTTTGITVGVLATLAGGKIMFTKTQVLFDTLKSFVEWHHSGIFQTTYVQYRSSDVGLVLHETVIRNPRGPDWHGFAATLENKDKGTIQLARNKKMEAVKKYATEFREFTGVAIKEIGTEHTPVGNIPKCADMSIEVKSTCMNSKKST